MIINVSGISQGTTRLAGQLAARELQLDNRGVKPVSPVSIDAKLVKMGLDVYVDAAVSILMELECSRCLEHFTWQLRSRLQVLYVPATGRSTQSVADDECSCYHENTIDLTENIRTLIAFELPRKPLCRDDCPGLCPRCGKPLSDGPCPCLPPETGYRPFDGLKLE